MPLTPQQEAEIYPIIDKALDQPPGKGALYKCKASRAEYLTRMIRGLRYDSAIESIEMYKPDEPLYGLGSYANLWVEPHDRGLLATVLPEPFSNLMWQLIQCAAWKKSITLIDCTFNYARQRLVRVQKKYPEIMNHVYITDHEPWPTADYGEPSPEEILVVDIDVNPNRKPKGPTAEETARAGFPMQNPPKH